uniref:Ice-binding protein C-terminal domain-containing protein n=1 Tax=Leptospirillum ferrodiazotrophum TaxID=412449 RepID=C6HV77_9BACT|nr:MAG: hypothetical protein UBAL3_78920041 [Leptospirillum ferrodiazotrophum]
MLDSYFQGVPMSIRYFYKQKMTRFVLRLILVILTFPVFFRGGTTATAMTLEQAIRSAVQNNKDLQAAQYVVNVSGIFGGGGAGIIGGGGGSSYFDIALGSESVDTIGENAGNGFVTLSLVSSPSSPSATPEPSTWLLFGTGVGLLGVMAVRKKKELRNTV